MEGLAKVADKNANKPYADWTAKDKQNALIDTMCFYLNVPKMGPNSTPDGTEQPILCANSLADMQLFKDVINSLNQK